MRTTYQIDMPRTPGARPTVVASYMSLRAARAAARELRQDRREDSK